MHQFPLQPVDSSPPPIKSPHKEEKFSYSRSQNSSPRSNEGAASVAPSSRPHSAVVPSVLSEPCLVGMDSVDRPNTEFRKAPSQRHSCSSSHGASNNNRCGLYGEDRPVEIDVRLTNRI